MASEAARDRARERAQNLLGAQSWHTYGDAHYIATVERVTDALLASDAERAALEAEVERLRDIVADWTLEDESIATLRAERDAAIEEARVGRRQYDEVYDRLQATRSRLDEAVRLLREVYVDTNAVRTFLATLGDARGAASQPSPSTPVPRETGGGGAPGDET